MSYASFIAKWTHPEFPPKSVDASEFRRVENALKISLPAAFKDALATSGAASATLDLLDAIVDQGFEIADVHDFLTPDEIVEATGQWRELGLPDDAVAFATDCSGNLFCFRRGAYGIWLWDHDFNEIEQIAADFTSWIELYCAIEGGVNVND
ncbi:MAG: SMI1/KNR4 family protein [Hyphomonadaceae bacterium]|nr:SMI1/KNR4 family protein [Hyphomonadaceae bacterium]